jgi:hypothetical protein
MATAGFADDALLPFLLAERAQAVVVREGERRCRRAPAPGMYAGTLAVMRHNDRGNTPTQAG